MPGFTHLQAAQPVTLGHHLLAYVEMLGRDRSPLRRRPPSARRMPARRRRPRRHQLSDRPRDDGERSWASIGPGPTRSTRSPTATSSLDYLAAAATTAVHLSRLAEELVLWSTRQFGFVVMSESFSTGSSIMPQKRNPDGAELLRGKSGRVIGALVSLLAMLKGLPLTYSKDMQEDKEPLFDAVDTLELCLEAAAPMLQGVTFRRDRMLAAAGVGFTTATDLADWCVRALDLPFRSAHQVAGRAVRAAEDRGCELEELPLALLQEIEPRITAEVFEVLGVERSVASRTSVGGTAPARVRAAVVEARTRFLETIG